MAVVAGVSQGPGAASGAVKLVLRRCRLGDKQILRSAKDDKQTRESGQYPGHVGREDEVVEEVGLEIDVGVGDGAVEAASALAIGGVLPGEDGTRQRDTRQYGRRDPVWQRLAAGLWVAGDPDAGAGNSGGDGLDHV